MIITHKLRVTSSRAYLESAPPFVAGTADTVRLEVTFDEGWDGFQKILLAEQAGSDIRWRLLPDEKGGVALPDPLTERSVPFFLWAEGEREDSFLRTNSVCIRPEALCTGDGEEDAISRPMPVYALPYQVTENGVYPTKNHFLTENLTVDVPPVGVDTSMDTVSPDTMLSGVTAHDAIGQGIAGAIPTYGGANSTQMTSPAGVTLPVEGVYCPEDIAVAPLLQSVDVTENGSYLPAEGFAGIGRVAVDVRPPLQEKTVTRCGTVTPDEGFYGLSEVDVQVTADGVQAVSNATGMLAPCEIEYVSVTAVIPTISTVATATGELT